MKKVALGLAVGCVGFIGLTVFKMIRTYGSLIVEVTEEDIMKN